MVEEHFSLFSKSLYKNEENKKQKQTCPPIKLETVETLNHSNHRWKAKPKGVQREQGETRPLPLHNPEGAQGPEAPGIAGGKSEREGLRGDDLEKREQRKVGPWAPSAPHGTRV